MTILCSVLTGLGLVGNFAVSFVEKSTSMNEPQKTLERVIGRNLDADDYRKRLPDWRKLLDFLTGDKRGATLKSSVGAFRDHIKQFPSIRSRRTLAILLAEAGLGQEVEVQLNQLAKVPGEEDFIAAVRYAYVRGVSHDQVFPLQEVLSSLHLEWARDKLEVRIAERRGDLRAAASAQERLAKRGRILQRHIASVLMAEFGLIALGLLVLATWRWRGLPNLQIGAGCVVSPWNFRDGCAVLVRGIVAGILVVFMAGLVDGLVAGDFESIAAGGATKKAGSSEVLEFIGYVAGVLPLLFLASKHLFRPVNHTVGSCFGLSVAHPQWPILVVVILALNAIESVGEVVIGAFCSGLGFDEHWTEGLFEELLWGSWPAVALHSFIVTLVAPISEEIVFRGFIYSTFRRKLPVFSAAAVSSLIFAAIHGYGLEGFLTVMWAGYVWALAFEHTRSLLPGMVSHSLSNTIVIATQLVMYRL